MNYNSIFLLAIIFISFTSLTLTTSLRKSRTNALQTPKVCSCKIPTQTNNSTPPINNSTPPIIIPDQKIQIPQGPWIGDVWENAAMGFKVIDGAFIPTSPNLIRYLNSAKAAAGIPAVDLNNIANNPPNVQRIMRLFKKSDWDYLFPVADKVYSYTTFLQAAAKFPAFCNEKADWLQEDLDLICKKEMITMWSHWNQETGGHSGDINGITQDERQALYYLNEMGCENGGCEYRSTCSGWIQEAYPCAVGKKYFGRGSKQVSYNFNYGPFSKLLFGDVQVLLNDPERVSREGWLAVASGFWFYMTPQSPKPSIHDVITGFWVPNSKDTASGFKRGFGTSINIINGGVECGAKIMPQAQNRVRYYKFFAGYMNVPIAADELLDCSSQPGAFVEGGSGTVFSYWDQDWNNPNRCQLVAWQTAFSLFFPDSYYKCVQKHALGMAVTA